MLEKQRILGRFVGQERGPMLLLFGAMHGNEPAGVEAIKMLFRELALEPHHNPNFTVRGSVLGLIGNARAYDKKVRFINKDLNRSWTDENVNIALNGRESDLTEEQLEIRESIDLIKQHVEKYSPTEIIMLDLHTTSSKGGIFTITSEDEKSLDLGKNLHAPVVTGILKGLKGTTIHFFRGENMGLKTTALSFESGHHDDILSPGRAYAAIVNCLKSIGCVRPQDVENRHDKILMEFSKNLPKVNDLMYKYSIPEGAKFEMLPGFISFDKIKKGQLIALTNNEEVRSLENGRILMPLYQTQGEEGFFIIRSIDSE